MKTPLILMLRNYNSKMIPVTATILHQIEMRMTSKISLAANIYKKKKLWEGI